VLQDYLQNIINKTIKLHSTHYQIIPLKIVCQRKASIIYLVKNNKKLRFPVNMIQTILSFSLNSEIEL